MASKITGRAWGAAALAIALSAAAQGQVFYSETFDADLGAMSAANDGETSNGWVFDSTCPAAPLAGHSAPGTAHWIAAETCFEYGSGPSSDALSTGRIEVPAECGSGVRIEYNYFLDLDEDACYDRARVEVFVDGSGPLVVGDNGGCDGESIAPGRTMAPTGAGGNSGLGNLRNLAAWSSGAALVANATPGTLIEVRFVGETDDEIANDGEAFYVDDVVLSCQAAAYEIPALGPTGFAALVALLGSAALVVLARRRRA